MQFAGEYIALINDENINIKIFSYILGDSQCWSVYPPKI
jgi:hypothetical protein